MARRRRRSVKTRVRRVGRAVGRGVKGSVLQLAAGAVGQLGSTAAAGRVGFLASNWWASPALVAVLGHLAKRRRKLAGIGDALLGAAGFQAAQQYQMNSGMVAQAAETGALYPGYETGALINPHMAGYLNDQADPTSSHYAGAEPEAEQAADVSEAQGLY